MGKYMASSIDFESGHMVFSVSGKNIIDICSYKLKKDHPQFDPNLYEIINASLQELFDFEYNRLNDSVINER